ALPQLRLEAQELAQALPLRAVLSPPLEDRVEELLGARPRIVAQDRLDLAGERTAFVDVACLELREGESVAHDARITDSVELRPVESVLVPHAADLAGCCKRTPDGSRSATWCDSRGADDEMLKHFGGATRLKPRRVPPESRRAGLLQQPAQAAADD